MVPLPAGRKASSGVGAPPFGEMDPGETRELWSAEGYAHLWVMKPVMSILSDLARSMERYPNIKPGQDFTGYQ